MVSLRSSSPTAYGRSRPAARRRVCRTEIARQITGGT
jgi:hypothetical protein